MEIKDALAPAKPARSDLLAHTGPRTLGDTLVGYAKRPRRDGEFDNMSKTGIQGLSRLEVALDHDTVWLSQTQMAALFDKDIRTVGEQIRNIYSEKDLDKDSTIRNLRIVRQEGNRGAEAGHNVDRYSVEVTISEYRAQFQRCAQFRQ